MPLLIHIFVLVNKPPNLDCYIHLPNIRIFERQIIVIDILKYIARHFYKTTQLMNVDKLFTFNLDYRQAEYSHLIGY